MSDPHLDELGRFLMEHLRDSGISFAEVALEGKWKAPSLVKLQSELAKLSPEQQATVLACVTRSIDSAIHAFLFALGERRSEIQLRTKGDNAIELSDGLHGEPYGEAGWIERFSKFDDKGHAV
jgi:hypothetical protein